jgi:hypothetical protein
MGKFDMRIASPPRFLTVVRTEKEARLKSFIAEALSFGAGESGPHAPVSILVRNPDSPVARALYAAFAEGLVPGTNMQILLGEALQEEPAQASILDVPGVEIRYLGDARFGAAHEQLVIGQNYVWIGDCLRRDPTKRDAFEVFHAKADSHSHFAIVSFRNLWAAAQPLIRAKADTMVVEIVANGQTDDPESRPFSHRQ